MPHRIFVAIKTVWENEVFAGEDVPEVYQEAINEFNAQKDTLAKLINSDWQEAAKKISKLKINQLTRENFTEVLYRQSWNKR